jgi:inner membrane protein
MDNVTHTLVGLAVAELVVRSRRDPPDPRFHGLALFFSALGNNLPDLDFLWTRITPGPLGYLLHHRGYTHTLSIALLLGAAMFAGAAYWARRRGVPLDRRGLAIVCLAGPVLHVSMDALNSYGVHPFWPLSDRWFYGDTLFVLEPMLWAALAPPLLFAPLGRVGKTLVVLVLVLSLTLPITSGLVPASMSGLTALFALGMLALSVRASPRRRAIVALGGALGLVLLFSLARQVALARLERRIAQVLPNERVVDIVLSPFPANPVCWAFIVVGSDAEARYRAARGRVSVATSILPARSCELPSAGSSAPLFVPNIAPTEAVLFAEELAVPLEELRSLARDNCDFAALLHFARVPFWASRRGDDLVLGDLRFDHSSALEFGELRSERHPARCPPFVPPWAPPRQDLVP